MGAHERCSTQVGSGLTHKYKTRKEMLARDEHPSVFGPFVSKSEKKFYKIDKKKNFCNRNSVRNLKNVLSESYSECIF